MSRRAGAESGRAGVPGTAIPGEDSGVGPASTGQLEPVLSKLVATAKAELDRHTNHQGACTKCEMSWPCDTACITAFTLEAVGDES